MPYTGKGVVVGVMDYAIDFQHRGLQHPDRDVKRVNYARTHTDRAGAIALGQGHRPSEHGTQMAGIIAAQMPDQKWHGIAPDVDLVGLNLYEQDKAKNLDDDLFVELIEVAIAEKVQVLNLSFVAYSGDTYGRKKAALQRLIAKGCLVCCASGNERLEKEEPLGFPACLYLEGLLVVGACEMETKALFYHAPHDENISFFVPVQSLTTLGEANGTYQFPQEDSSSVATAIVSGVAALLLEANPLLTPKQLAHILSHTGEPLPEAGNRPACWGKRSLDAERALKLAERYHI